VTAAVRVLMLLGVLAAAGPIPAAASGPSAAPAEASSLTVSLSVEQPKIVEPFPARVTLHLHNAGASPLWLYRHVRDPQDLKQARYQAAEAGNAEGLTSGGSSLAIHLEPAEAGTEKLASPGPSGRSFEQSGERARAGAGLPRGRVLASVGMPHPRLVAIAAGGDATEGAVIEVQPAQGVRGGRDESVWGRYRFSITYSAAYSNGNALSRNLGVDVWQGEVNSNPVDIDLEPAPPGAAAAGSVAGRITREDGRPLVRMLVSLSDHEDHLVGQVTTGEEGKYAFNHLPWGLYWVTARRPGSDFETATYDHVDLEAGDPVASLNLVMLQPEVYEPKQMLHKPVLLRVTQSSGQPLQGVALEALWSSGTVAETVKGETAQDGTAPLELIPGRNYVTLKRHGCRDEERRVDVAAGDGIDGVSLQFDCNGS
jgi:Carboxypeptidase regulatory-like domain